MRIPARVIPSGTVFVERRRVQVDGIAIETQPVTRAQYREFIAAGGARPPLGWNSEMPRGTAELPVVGVSYDDAAAYAKWAGARLPTEPEWQLAAAGLDSSADEAPTLQPGPGERGVFGLQNLGTVWELTSTELNGGHVVRGGTWRDRAEPANLGNRSFETEPAQDVGFRLIVARPAPIERTFSWLPAMLAPIIEPTAEQRWLSHLLSSAFGRRCHLAQQLASCAVVESFREEPIGHFVVNPTHRRLDVPDFEGYLVEIGAERLRMSHSKHAGGTWGLQQVISHWSEVPLEAIREDGMIAAFVTQVCQQFPENFSART